MKLVTVPEILAIEQAADAAGHTYAAMMERAGHGLAHQIHENLGARKGKLLALVGKGNNGGDTLIALTHLEQWGWDCTALLVDRPLEDDLAQRAGSAGCQLLSWGDVTPEDLSTLVGGYSFLLDGLLGTGIRLPLRGPSQTVLALIKQQLPALKEPPVIVAVDVPSGVDAVTGEAAPETLHADLTVTMAAAKTGHFAFPAATYTGRLALADIGLPDDLHAWQAITREVVDNHWVRENLPPRPPDAHKGTFGSALVVAGSRNYVGAALLAGRAAARSGVGTLTLACPEGVYRLLAGHFPEATWLPLPERDGAIAAEAAPLLLENLGRTTGLLLGPGFGLADHTRLFIENFLAQTSSHEFPEVPMIFDADGLKLLSQLDDWPRRLPPQTILTPHPGEMAILTGLAVPEIQRNRLEVAEKYARIWGHVVVLKGAFTLVAAPDGRTALIPVATTALAHGGTGDVLAGLAAGLRAQGLGAFEAAVCAAWLHAEAGLAAERQLGSPAAVLAGDVLAGIPDVLRGLGELDQRRDGIKPD